MITARGLETDGGEAAESDDAKHDDAGGKEAEEEKR